MKEKDINRTHRVMWIENGEEVTGRITFRWVTSDAEIQFSFEELDPIEAGRVYAAWKDKMIENAWHGKYDALHREKCEELGGVYWPHIASTLEELGIYREYPDSKTIELKIDGEWITCSFVSDLNNTLFNIVY